MSSPVASKKRRISPLDSGTSNSVSLPEEFENTAGKVIKVTLINFLNHAHLTINCSPNLNLIFGRNGQGKSAIVQGIALCFGGSGHSVGRDANLNHYIKDYHLQNGPNFARVELQLSNQGMNSYQPETYGDVIILTRTIYKNSSCYAISGLMSKKNNIDRRTLAQYLRHVKINVSNPTTYMDQEMCKSFFFQSSAHSFYKYYSAAAGLDQMEEKINAEKNNLEVCKAELKIRKRVLQPDRENIENLSKQIISLEENLKELKQAKESYRLALYKVEKDKYNVAKERYDKFVENDPRNEIKELEDQITSLTDLSLTVKSQIQELIDQSTEHKDKIRNISDNLSVSEESINEFVHAFLLFVTHRIKSSMLALHSNISQIEIQLNKMDSEDKPAEPETKREIVQLKEELENVTKEYDQLHNRHQSLFSELSNLEKQKLGIENQMSEVQADLDELKRENDVILQSLNTNDRIETNRKFLYKYDPSSVRRAISKAKSSKVFIHEPIGPIGEYLKTIPTVPSWKVLPIIERHLKRVILVWLVATETDRAALEKILVSEGCDPNNVKIMKTSFFHTNLDLSSNVEKELAKSKFQSVLYKYLAVNEIPQVLLNIMIELFNISKTAICKDEKELFDVLNNNGLNITAAYTLNNADFGKRVNGSLFFSPSYDRNPHVYRYVRYSGGAKMDHTNEFNERLAQGRERENVLRTSSREITKKLKNNTTQILVLKSKINTIKNEKTNLLKTKTRLESDLSNEIIIDSMTLLNSNNKYNNSNTIKEKYTEQLADLNKKMEDYENQLTSVFNDKKRHESAMKETQIGLNTILKQISEKKIEFQNTQNQINSNKSKIRKLSENIRKYNSILDDHLKEIKELSQRINKYEHEFNEDGIEYTDNVPTKKPEEYLRIVDSSRLVVANLAKGSDGVEQHLSELKDKRLSAEESLRDKELRLQETQKNYSDQKINYTNRCKRFDEYRSRMEQLAKVVFKRTLEMVCGYDGSLIFNDVNRTLDIHIHNKQQSYSKAHVARDLKTLSGGEQSSIQLSMIHSLASLAFSPIHLFDEIDVYMDESTRSKNINAIIQFASNNRDRQLFLLTPHMEFAKHIAEMYPDITKIFNVSKQQN
ncbi:hypothetical protein BEWA_033540 [Theileria equi strain WA]|uniref:Rad50/SbcC-type AAA domain-containing protein n=1 Tax=Theileria equi strain WA TaxID=1537102 RepID=L0B048_THEEQ|nr:hypothetical protein BEWA_033540 [Theileria equi strain WA]AFZ80499.1 hypothetical protein BEWA_033540 [Theileria equi strain WA]|eukprot:XP_004830165.1 hypothetical protein BEWA_033540 [Theileria equi strain WA]